MNQLLIIDDEPYIVDSLYDLFSDIYVDKLEIFRAYSVDEAISILNTQRINIVLSDINMPGVTGLELLEEIKKYYSGCKVLFLTGYDNFEYVQKAIRYGGVDYILKTEDEDVLVEAIDKVLTDISKTKKDKKLMDNAVEQLNFARPLIKKEYLLHAIRGESSIYSLNDNLIETILPLDRKRPCFLTLGRIDSVDPSRMDNSNCEANLQIINNVGKKYFNQSYFYEMVNVDKYHFIWLLQSKSVEGEGECVDSIYKILRFVQNDYRLQGTTVSYISSKTLILWDKLPSKYRELETIARIGTSHLKEILLTDEHYKNNIVSKNEHDRDILTQTQKLNSLATYLESGTTLEFNHLFEEIKKMNEKSPYPVYKEVYYVLVGSMMTQANRLGLGESFLDSHFYQTLEEMKNAPRTDAFQFFSSKFNELLDIFNEKKEGKSNEIVTKIHQYIHDNIQCDLSLGKLGEVVYLNPQYLCRIYKQETGIGLSEYIADVRLTRAKELLRDTYLKAHEVAKEIGFESAGYFNRFFKKFVKMTPIEYRENVTKSNFN